MLAALGRLQSLETLSITFGEKQEFSSDDIEPLSRLIRLRSLNVSRNVAVQENEPVPDDAESVALGNAILRVAGSLPNLRTLWVIGIVTSDAGLDAIAAAPQFALSP